MLRASLLLRNLAQKIRPGYQKGKMKPKILKHDTLEFRNLLTAELRKLSDLFKKNNYELRIAGGAVRDLLMGIQPADVDFASTATPTEMKKLFEKEQIRMLHKRGEEHGTITCRIDEKANFEITTLRVDLVCDGRRAEVEYTTDWQLDANRRDLTINSLFIDLDGNVIDYFNGIEDVKNRRVAFVGDAEQRIQEDYLRILRYFRFFGRISNTSNHEEKNINAIKKWKDGLKGISAERIWTELKKIVVGRMAPDVLKDMLDTCELAPYLGLPNDYNLKRFEEVYKNYSKEVLPMTMIASLCNRNEDVENFHAKTKLSNAERDLGRFVVAERKEAEENKENNKWWTDRIVNLEVKPGPKIQNGKKCVIQLGMSVGLQKKTIESLENFGLPKYPIDGNILMKVGVPSGQGMKLILDHLFEVWKESDYKMEEEELLKHVGEVVVPPDSKRKKSR